LRDRRSFPGTCGPRGGRSRQHSPRPERSRRPARAVHACITAPASCNIRVARSRPNAALAHRTRMFFAEGSPRRPP
jgi:hypothetical protein